MAEDPSIKPDARSPFAVPEQSTNSIIPWVIVFMMSIYVIGLSYYATHRTVPEPAFAFYNTTQVNVRVYPSEMDHSVYGIFHNIIESSRKTLEAQPDSLEEGQFVVNFEVNSPRPAELYLNDNPISIFLIPDSNLSVSLFYDSLSQEIDSVSFQGFTEGICNYYREKNTSLGRSQVRAFQTSMASPDLLQQARFFDSLARNELSFLLIRSDPNRLPSWFIDFEKNEILYQKAYLKLFTAKNQEPYPGYLDEVMLSNEGAVFSYYYYLFLDTYFNKILADQGQALATGVAGRVNLLNTAAKELVGESFEVYATRVVFQFLNQNGVAETKRLMEQVRPLFDARKYLRFLAREIEKREQ